MLNKQVAPAQNAPTIPAASTPMQVLDTLALRQVSGGPGGSPTSVNGG